MLISTIEVDFQFELLQATLWEHLGFVYYGGFQKVRRSIVRYSFSDFVQYMLGLPNWAIKILMGCTWKNRRSEREWRAFTGGFTITYLVAQLIRFCWVKPKVSFRFLLYLTNPDKICWPSQYFIASVIYSLIKSRLSIVPWFVSCGERGC